MAAVVAVEVPPLLLAVHRIVGGVQVDDHLVRFFVEALHEDVEQQVIDRLRSMIDLLVSGLRCCVWGR